jgi:RHS repeat-associated protein
MTAQNKTGTCFSFSATALTNNQLTGYSYDAAGNVINDGVHSYSYDAEGRIVQVDGGTTASYIYNENGKRARKTVGGAFTEFYYGPNGSVQSEYNGSSWPVQYIHSGDRLIAEYTNSTTEFIHSDHLGSTRLVTAMDKSVVDNLDYEPFGQQASGASATTHKFTGKERDSESSLDYFGMRHYASTMGRWMVPDRVNVTEDRVVNPANTLNKYVYGGNNPLKYVDPDGRDITLFYTPEGPGGHAMLLAYNQETGDSAVQSFGPANHDALTRVEEFFSIPVPGTDNYGFQDITSADQLRQQYASITIQTSPEETQEAINFIRTHPDNGSYITLANNCTSTCARILRHIKLLKTHDIDPGGLFSHLARSYSTQGNPLFPTLGKDYGNPRPGYNAFDLLFLSIQQQQQPREKVTTRICWTDENGNTVCQ